MPNPSTSSGPAWGSQGDSSAPALDERVTSLGFWAVKAPSCAAALLILGSNPTCPEVSHPSEVSGTGFPNENYSHEQGWRGSNIKSIQQWHFLVLATEPADFTHLSPLLCQVRAWERNCSLIPAVVKASLFFFLFMKKCTHVKLALVLVTDYTEHWVINRVMYLVSDSRLQHRSHWRALSEVEQDRLEVEELKFKKK